MLNYYNDKKQYMKNNVPVQEELIKKIEATADLSLDAIDNVEVVIRQERDLAEGQFSI